MCPCSRITEYVYLTSFNIARPITYFKYKSIIIFKDISELLSHLKPLVVYTGVSDNINLYHQILYFWLIIYRQMICQYCSRISLSNNDKQRLIENIHHSISNKKCEVKNTSHVNSISNLSVLKSKKFNRKLMIIL